MNIELIVIGKTDSSQIETLLNDYLKRLNFLHQSIYGCAAGSEKSQNAHSRGAEKQEGEILLRRFTESDIVVLLDEKGKQMRSVEFATWVQKWMNSGIKRLCFCNRGDRMVFLTRCMPVPMPNCRCLP